MKTTKKFLALVLAIALGFTCFPTNVFAVNTQGVVNTYTTEIAMWDGTTTQPTKRETIDGVEYYKIYTPEELAYIAQAGGDWLTYNYILANDIVLNDVELTYDANGTLTVDATTLNQWTPINGFRGIFNGNNFTVSGVYVNTTSSAGFFANCRGDVSNLTITNSYIKGGSQVGGICGSFNETGKDMTNCYFDGAVVGTSSVGGLIGSNNTTNISNCGNYGDVWGTGDYVCGIVGSFYAYGIDNCFNEGNIYSTGNYVAGIAGTTDIYGIGNCINKGNVTGNDYVAGVCAYVSDANISGGNFGNITGRNYVGGLVGYNARDTYNSYVSGYNIGAVSGTNCVGGIIGYATCCNISNAYSVGNVSGRTKVGAIAGYSDTVWGKGTASNCYYFKDSLTNAHLTGFGNAPDAEGVVRSKKAGYFPILSDANADPSYSNLGYKNGEVDDPIEDGSSEVQPPAAETVWDGTTLQPSVMVSIDGIYYYKIYTGKELAYIAQNGGDWLTYNYILANNIVLNNVALTYDANGNLTVDATTLNKWMPINGFTGVFNGGGFSISGVYVNTTSSAGFFTSFNGDLYNLSIVNSYIKGQSNVGGMFSSVSKVGGKIEYAYFDGAVVGNSSVGGLIGSANCTYARNCGNYGDVWGTGGYVAGLSGSFSSYGIYDCFNDGNVYSTGDYVSGITGSTSNYTISNCINRGNITGKNYVSGIVSGTRYSHVTSCGNTGNITGEKYVGGICAYNGEYLYTTSIGSCYNSGTVTGSDHVGGIIGYLSTVSLSKCYNIGNVIGTTNVGAVAGYSDSIWGRGTVSNCCYLKNQTINTGLDGFGNADDTVGIVEAKEVGFFCVNTDRTMNMNGHAYDPENACDKDCNNCGSERVVQHLFNIITYPVEPTCSTTGEKHKTCSICGEVEIEITPARGHYVSIPGKEMVDSYTLSNDSEFPFALNDGWYASTNKSHSSTSIFQIRATYSCTLVLNYKVSSERNYDKLILLKNSSTLDTISGNISEKTCTIVLTAGDVLSIKYTKDSSASDGDDSGYFKILSCTQTEIDTTVYVSTETINPTCENDVVCESCHQIMKEALGHDRVHHEGKAPTCTEKGWEAYDTCTRCDYTTYEEIAATGHHYTDTVTAPTCTEKGYTTHTCTRCDDSYVDTYVEALGHDFGEWTETKAATCTEKGAERQDCSRCEHYETREVEALGHDYKATVTDPTCTEQGYTTHTCSRCTDSYVDTYVEALGHDLGAWTETKAATCTEKGEERRDCSRCEYYETREIEVLGHDYKDTVTAPTCTEQGYTTHTCTHCEDSYVDTYVEALGHDFGEWTETKAATCTEKGEERRDCSRCEHYETREVEALGHDYKATVTDPTCTEQGYTTHTCSRCEDSYVDTYVDALGHDLGEWTETKAATCTEKGEERRDCSRCEYYETREVEALGHDYKDTVTDPTCTEQGYTTHTCSRCDDSYVDTYVEALGHDLGKWTETKAATCTEKGEERRDCSRCEHYETHEIEVLGHDYKATVTDPTCTEQGYTTHTCARCGDSYVDTYVDALGHAWDDGVITKQPTATENGVKTFTCTRCGATRTEPIPATGDEPCDGGEDCPSGKFVDVNTKAWYHLYVDYAVKNGLFGGTSENTFEPEAAMTRAMLVTVLWRYEGKPMGYQNTFVDVNAKSGSWYIDAVAWAAANNIVGGIGNGKFDPEGKITREQMATILFRYANWKGIDTNKRGDLSNFPDADKVSGYATSAMQWAVAEGLINGSDGKLLPQGNATRAQVATILVRFIENIVKK